jgi:hypothetical protein
MARATIPDVAVRQHLVETGRMHVTLDGEPAVVSGWANEFASVQRKDGKGGTVTFAWATVQRILSTHRSFRS